MIPVDHSMAPHLLSLPLEIRLLIWTFVLVGSSEIVDVWEDGDDFELYLMTWEAKLPSSSPLLHATSLLQICHQVHAEVIPIFYRLVPLYLQDVPFNLRAPFPTKNWLQKFTLNHFEQAPRGVQSVIVPMKLACEIHTGSKDPANLLRHFPNLRTLTIYDSCDAWDVQFRHPRDTRDSVVDGIEQFYVASPVGYFTGRGYAYGAGRSYTLVHQAFVNTSEVFGLDHGA